MNSKVTEQRLGNGISVFSSEVHTFGTDAVLLADFSAPKKNDRAVEFGTGCGIISLLWCRSDAPKSIDAVDIQADACELVKMAIERFSLCDRLRIHNADLKELGGILPAGAFELVVMNPPYKSKKDGLKCSDKRIAIARHELMCNIDDITRSAARLLNTGGRLCLCSRPARLCDTMFSMRSAGIEPKKLRMVQQRFGSVPNLFLVSGTKGGKSGLVVDSPLIIEDINGDISEEVKKIYGEYYKMKEKK